MIRNPRPVEVRIGEMMGYKKDIIQKEYKNRRMTVLRKIKNGRVKIYGRYYYPHDYHREYKGELEGLNAYFGLYRYSDHKAVCLMYFPGFFESGENEPNHIDGYVYWIVWKVRSLGPLESSNSKT